MKATPSQPLDEIEREVVGDVDEDDEGGEAPSIPKSRAKEVGAVNAESVQVNRRRKTILDRKRDGEKNVPWGEKDACLLYDDIITAWLPQQILCHVTRISGGSRTSWYLQGMPRHGMELYEAVRKQCHGISSEAEYQVAFRDRSGRSERGRGTIIMPSTEFDQMAMPATGAPRDPQPPTAPAPMAAAPMPQQPSYGPPSGYGGPPAGGAPPQGGYDPVVVMEIQRQLSALQSQNEQLRQQVAMGQLNGPSRAPAPVPNAPPPPFVMMPPMQAPPATPAPAPARMPQIPPGYGLANIDGMTVLVPLNGLGLGLAPAAPAAQQPAAAAPVPLPPPLSPVDQMQQTVGVIRGAVDAIRSVQSVLPQVAAPMVAATAEEGAASAEDDSPTKVVKIGDVTTVQNVIDGSIRPVDTLIANAPAILTWMDKQRTEYLARQQGGQIAPPPPPPGGDIGAPPIPR
jgi:hypothetical protein